MTEEVKRLEPVKDTLRELFLKSGNECAFPGCDHKIISSDGVFLAQICHIEAANEGGERFNSSQTNEERRAFNNLMLMCHAHHKITDDKQEYTVQRLKDIKQQHESKFTDVISTIQNSFRDHTESSKVKNSHNLNRINRALSWEYTDEELAESIVELNSFSERLRSLPTQARQLYCVIIKVAQYQIYMGFHVSLHEVKLRIGSSSESIKEVIQVLEKYNFIQEGLPDDMGLPTIQLTELNSGWSIASDLKEFCQKENIILEEIINDLNFSVLGE
jgi:hypothetical protein